MSGRRRPAAVAITWTTRRRASSDAALRRAARAALAFGGRPGAPIALVFVSDRALAKLHGQWLGDPGETDVISFDLEGQDAGPVGELYVSVERAAAQAKSRGVRVERELALYVVHGCLHLCGYDDHGVRERRRMRAAESEVLAELGYEADSTPFE